MPTTATVSEAVNADRVLGGAYQLAIDQFVDAFRQATPIARASMIAEPPSIADKRLEALVAGVVHALCHECGTDQPEWLATVGFQSPKPFFVMKPEGGCSANFAMAQMLMTPPWFFIRNVFVPANYMSRA